MDGQLGVVTLWVIILSLLSFILSIRLIGNKIPARGKAMASSSRPTKRSRQADAQDSCIANESEHYDVFLSHRGPDTKTGFVGFLHKDLKLAGLKPFFDIRDIEKGEDSWESIERAIKKTQIALVVFSENFAGSKWCLRELHLMLETPSITVLPIFYKVKPSDLRHLDGGLLAAGFKKLQAHGCVEKDVENWRVDLEKASTIDGWVIEDNDQNLQADVVTSIVKKVYELSNKVLLDDVSGEHEKVGVKEAAEKIIETLDEKRNIVMVGLWGMGGIGKSTLARELFYRLSKKYASSFHVKDVTEKVSMPDGLEKVQKDILQGLCKGIAPDIQDKEEGRRLLEGLLRNKSPFLLLLDDVSDEKDMMKYIVSTDMLVGGSTCIVTTRDEGVLKEFRIGLGKKLHVHAMHELSSEDSERVFTSFAFGVDRKVEPEFEALVEGISKACGGVPLVLEVIGSCLRGIDDVSAWKEMKESLEESGDVLMDHKAIFDRLRRSYDTLSRNQQEMFLDIACGLIGQSVDLVKRVWKSSKWCPEINIPILVKRALFVIDDEGCFMMHDVLREMGRLIETRKKAGERARLWMPESLAKVKEKGLPKHLQTLVIKYPYFEDMQTLDVLHMKELRILICFGAVNVTSIPTNLRWFSSTPNQKKDWNSRRRITFPRIPQESKLVVLDLYGLQKCVFSCKQGHQPPCTVQGLGGLTALECLRLRDSKFDELPNLQRLNKLEELDICGSNFKAVPELGHLLALVKFKASICLDLVELPDIGNLTRLQILELSSYTKAIPGLSKIMPYLVKLMVSVEGLETPYVLNAMKLLTLEVWGWCERGPRAGINSMTLKSLTIHGSRYNTTKLNGLLEMKNLESIELDSCYFQEVLCLNHLTTLKSIRIQYCLFLETLPDLLGLTRLETLLISSCNYLREWTLLSKSRLLSGPALPSLQTLEFVGVAIKEWPDNLEVMFPQLKTKYLYTIEE